MGKEKVKDTPLLKIAKKQHKKYKLYEMTSLGVMGATLAYNFVKAPDAMIPLACICVTCVAHSAIADQIIDDIKNILHNPNIVPRNKRVRQIIKLNLKVSSLIVSAITVGLSCGAVVIKGADVVSCILLIAATNTLFETDKKRNIAKQKVKHLEFKEKIV